MLFLHVARQYKAILLLPVVSTLILISDAFTVKIISKDYTAAGLMEMQ